MGEIKVSDIEAMSVAERLSLIELIWDSLADSPELVPVPDWQREEIARRRAALATGTEPVTSWADARQRLLDTQ